MREIKFRAWNLLDKRMYLVKAFCFYGAKTATLQYNPIIKRNLDSIELMQSTGFSDKNDKEIYDGDIVKISGSDLRPRIVTIIYDDLYGAWKIYDHEWSVTDDLFKYATDMEDAYSNSVEVIGNIHENPELLEAVK